MKNYSKEQLVNWYKKNFKTAQEIITNSDSSEIKLESLMHVYDYSAKLVRLAHKVNVINYPHIFTNNYSLFGNGSYPLRSQLIKRGHISYAIPVGQELELAVSYWIICGDLYEAIIDKALQEFDKTQSSLKRNEYKKLINDLVDNSIENDIKTYENWEDFFSQSEFQNVNIIINQNHIQHIIINTNIINTTSTKASENTSKKETHADNTDTGVNVSKSNGSRLELFHDTHNNNSRFKVDIEDKENSEIVSNIAYEDRTVKRISFDISGLTDIQISSLKFLLSKGAAQYLKNGMNVFYDTKFHRFREKCKKYVLAYYCAQISLKLGLTESSKKKEDGSNKPYASWYYFQILFGEKDFAHCKREWTGYNFTNSKTKKMIESMFE